MPRHRRESLRLRMNSGTETFREELAWAAGLFEGEGSIGIFHVGGGYYYPQLVVNMTDEDVLQTWAGIFGARLCGPYANGSRLGSKPYWSINIKSFEGCQAVVAAL